MLKMAVLLASIFILCSSVLGQESMSILTLQRHDSSNVAPVQTIGVYVDEKKLKDVSHSTLMAEKWLRTNVLSYYPSTYINYIVVANDLCNDDKVSNREQVVRLTLDSMKNIYYSLTRWGLEREIKVSVSMTLNCVNKLYLKPVLGFLEEINSTYTANITQFSDEIVDLLMSELKLMNDVRGFQIETVNVVVPVLKQAKFMSRKLSFVYPLGLVATSPSQVVEFSPAPEIQTPVMSPFSSPSPQYGFNLPPCNPYPRVGYHAAPPPVVVGNGGGSVAVPPMVGSPGRSQAPPAFGNGGGSMAAPPTSGRQEGLWCVAKPSVPSDKLQVALDYACGAGGADCDSIKPNGSCYSPDSVVAHASYAFNSYWQKKKKYGGVCGFEGTAMLISSDPSFSQCHFILG